MNLLREIAATIWSDLYPKVKAVVDNIDAFKEEAVEEAQDVIRDVHTATSGQMQAQILDATAREIKKQTGEDLTGWRTSIIDTLKLVKKPSSLEYRRVLAAQNGFRGKFDGTAEQNKWLQGKVIEWMGP